jgi:hypothetical protein
MEIITKIFTAFLEILRLGKLPGFVVACICWVLLLLPTFIRRFISIDPAIQDHRGLIGLIAVISTVYFLAILIYDWSSKSIRNRRIKKFIIGNLKNLTDDEKSVLIPYIEKKSRTQYYEICNGVANGLEAKKILYLASSVGADYKEFPYNIQDIAYDYLVGHPELLKLDEKDIEFVYDEEP